MDVSNDLSLFCKMFHREHDFPHDMKRHQRLQWRKHVRQNLTHLQRAHAQRLQSDAHLPRAQTKQLAFVAAKSNQSRGPLAQAIHPCQPPPTRDRHQRSQLRHCEANPIRPSHHNSDRQRQNSTPSHHASPIVGRDLMHLKWCFAVVVHSRQPHRTQTAPVNATVAHMVARSIAMFVRAIQIDTQRAQQQ
jgi:hypothetical protein